MRDETTRKKQKRNYENQTRHDDYANLNNF